LGTIDIEVSVTNAPWAGGERKRLQMVPVALFYTLNSRPMFMGKHPLVVVEVLDQLAAMGHQSERLASFISTVAYSTPFK
jgi:hypothetical protein